MIAKDIPGVVQKRFDCGCELAWDKNGPLAVHVALGACKTGFLTPSTWEGKMRQFMTAHKGYLRYGRWVRRT